MFEQEADDNDDSDSAVSILEGQTDGFQIADLDAQTQTDAADAITEARERASGEPLANPQIADNTINEDAVAPCSA